MSSLQYLKVVVYFLILTELMRFSVEVLCCETFKFWVNVLMDYGTRSGNSLSLGIPEAPQVNIKETQASKLGDAPEGIPSFFNKYRYVFGFVSFMRYVQILERLLHLVFTFLLCTMLVWDSPWLIYRMLIALHLIFLVWLYRMLHVLHLYHLKFGLPVSLHIENRHL